MESLSSTPKRSTSSGVQAMVWLIIALIFGVLTFMLWMASTAPSMQPSEVTQSESSEVQAAVDFSKITHVDDLNELSKEVEPISFDALVRDLRNYPDEFKDKSYFRQHENDWTVQVMDVAEHEVITDYLESREDRDKFAYFRYRDENNNPRYILTYDVLSTPQLAIGTAKVVDFKLPDNVRVLPEEMKRYLSIIENYEITQPVADISLNQSRRVRLRPAQKEIPPPVAPPVRREEPLQADDNNNDDENEQHSIADSNDASDTLSVNVARTPSIAPDNSGDNNASVGVNQEGTTRTNSNNANATANTNSTVGSQPVRDQTSTQGSSNNATNNRNGNSSNSGVTASNTTPATVQPLGVPLAANRNSNNNVAPLPTPQPVPAIPPSRTVAPEPTPAPDAIEQIINQSAN